MRKLWGSALAALLVLALAAPAWAQGPTIKIGGKVLVDVGYYNRSKELTGNGSQEVTTYFTDIPSHTPLNFRFTSPDKTTGAFVELGLKSYGGSASVSLRYAYGWYKIGNLTIIAGHTATWFGSAAYSAVKGQAFGGNLNHVHLWGWGHLWGGREPQVAIKYQTGPWSLYFSLEEPQNRNVPNHDAMDLYNSLPRTSVAVQYRSQWLDTMPAINYTHHQMAGAPTGYDDSWDTWAVVLPFKIGTGPLTLIGQLHYGINFASEYLYYPDDTGIVHTASGSVEDTTVYGGHIGINYTIGRVTVAAGYGYEHFANDAWIGTNGYAFSNYDHQAWYLAMPFKVNPYFTFNPGFAYFDHGDNARTGGDSGSEWLMGVEFQFVF